MNKCTEEKLMTRQNYSEYLRSKQVLKKKLEKSGNTHTLKKKKEKKRKTGGKHKCQFSMFRPIFYPTPPHHLDLPQVDCV